MSTLTFQVRRDSLATTRIVDDAAPPLADGQVRVQIDHFAFTSNNITYAAFGAAMHYWQFFPVADADAATWGCIPVWGFGRVVQSLHPGVAVGERLYGYWPMASHAVLQPARLSAAGFADGAAHRAGLHAVYNQYSRCASDPYYSADTEGLQALLRPLYLTAWLIDDFLADKHWFGTDAGAQAQPPSTPPRPAVMLLSSASSKTAYATAERLARRPGLQVVGLTSAANIAFCQSLGVYHRVLAYEQLDALPADTPCIYIDFAGNAALRMAVHQRFSALAHSSAIGGTHVAQLGGGRDLPGPPATLFFAPAQIKKRSADWGPGEFGKRIVSAWHDFRAQVAQPAAPWLVVQEHSGAQAVSTAYAQVLGGRGDPRIGHLLSLSAFSPA